ncbi:MAG: radical SAM protein [Promethearchaeota archaeon]
MEGFEIAAVRPPTENFSLSIATQFNCPWRKCAFCGSSIPSKTRKFQQRTLEDVKQDINNAAELNENIVESGSINPAKALSILPNNPELSNCIYHLIYWHLYTNGTTAFLGGANPLIYKEIFLVEILNHLQNRFPTLNRITSYGRTRTASKKNPEYFSNLHNAGLDRIHVGLESGANSVLTFMNKGVTSEGHIIGGKNIKEGGISLCTYVMPGLGGKNLSEEHALETARVLNEVEPDFVRLRTLEIFPFTGLFFKKKAGEFQELTEEEVVREEKLLIENITCNTTITSDSAANLLLEIWGELPYDKKKILRAIDDYLNMDENEKLEFSLQRRLEAFESQYGGITMNIKRRLDKLANANKNDENYYKKVYKLVRYIRQRLIP